MLECTHVTKAFRRRDGTSLEVIRDFSLTVGNGEFVSIVGPSGCGKTTILRQIAGLENVESGEIRVDGDRVEGPGRDRGVVFQHFALFPWLTVEGNIAWGPRRNGVPKHRVREIVDRYLTLTGLASFARAYPHTLSGGMKQRVAIARTLANEPNMVLMDEPFGALDSQTRSQMQEFLEGVWERDSKTVIFVTHDLEEALFLSDRVALMSGRPASVRHVMSVPFGRTRSHALKTSDQFFALKRELSLMFEHASLPPILCRS